MNGFGFYRGRLVPLLDKSQAARRKPKDAKTEFASPAARVSFSPGARHHNFTAEH